MQSLQKIRGKDNVYNPQRKNDYIIVEPEGYLDSTTSSDFVDYIDKLSSNGFSKIIISMEEISYISLRA
jgi:anti-anti-sigma regulatory factor